MKVLVIGGAGYIGSHTCKYLALSGNEVVVYDNLSTGYRQFVKWGDFELGDIRDIERLKSVLNKHKPYACIHFAGHIDVALSVLYPGKYYDNNVVGSLNIIEALCQCGVKSLVVSSSCAVYGLPKIVPISEDCPLDPISPYGRTKVMMEWILKDIAATNNLKWVSLRYFNAAGADADADIGEKHEPETHLIPNVFRAIDKDIPALELYGDDYDTPDGTCIRDYIHVTDLALAHVLSLEYLNAGKASLAINLGSGLGLSVKEIIQAAQKITGQEVPYSIKGRRSGDSAKLIANSSLAKNVLDWTANLSDVDTIISSAWEWHKKSKTIILEENNYLKK